MKSLSIGEVIAALRKEKGITQEVLSQNLSVSIQAVSKWETNVTSPDVSLLPLIADFFNVSIDALFGRASTSKNFIYNGISKLCNSPMLINQVMQQCWDLEFAAVGTNNFTDESMSRIRNSPYASRVVTNEGFTNMKNDLGFVVMPDPQTGWGALFANENICELFKKLSDIDFMKVLAFLAGKGMYNFTLVALSTSTNVEKDKLGEYIKILMEFRLVEEKKVLLDEGETSFYAFSSKRLPMLLVSLGYAQEFIEEIRCYNAYRWNRGRPFI